MTEQNIYISTTIEEQNKRIIQINTSQVHKFHSNYIKTARFNMFTTNKNNFSSVLSNSAIQKLLQHLLSYRPYPSLHSFNLALWAF